MLCAYENLVCCSHLPPSVDESATANRGFTDSCCAHCAEVKGKPMGSLVTCRSVHVSAANIKPRRCGCCTEAWWRGLLSRSVRFEVSRTWNAKSRFC